MKPVNHIILVLVIVGGLNWPLAGTFKINLRRQLIADNQKLK